MQGGTACKDFLGGGGGGGWGGQGLPLKSVLTIVGISHASASVAFETLLPATLPLGKLRPSAGISPFGRGRGVGCRTLCMCVQGCAFGLSYSSCFASYKQATTTNRTGFCKFFKSLRHKTDGLSVYLVRMVPSVSFSRASCSCPVCICPSAK